MCYLTLLLVTIISVQTGGGHLVLLTADQVFLFFASLIIIFGRGGEIIISLSRYLILILSFEAMRGVADDPTNNVNYATPIAFDMFLGGGKIPTEILQDHLAHLDNSLGLLAVLFYALHFFVPFLFAIYLWYKKRSFYEPYFLTLLVATYLSLITFLLFPVAPPWMASDMGLIDTRHLIFEVAESHHITTFPNIYFIINANPVAAFPSLHMVYPLLIGYFGYRAFGRSGLLLSLYPLLMGFSIIYLGEHYVFDLVGSILYSAFAIIAVAHFINVYHKSNFSTIYDSI